MPGYLLAIDQGTTSSRAMIFDGEGKVVGLAQREFPQHFPADGWVEHDPEDIWDTTVAVCREVLTHAQLPADALAAIGIANQRETTLIWDRNTGEPIHNAIVWQDRRTAELCERLRAEDAESTINAKTGLLIDPYFSATKIRWLLDNVPGARVRAERGELAFGTVDTFLLWRLTGGREHRTDATNASRTLLFNIHTQQWDPELLALFGVPESLLPEVEDSSAEFGATDTEWLGGAVPITGVAGDQQAALVGQACFTSGMAKSTYGTGCFLIVNTGEQALQSQNRLLTTVGYRLGGRVSYALEGSIFVAGAAMQWLRDGLRLIKAAPDSERHAMEIGYDNNVYLVPAFTGLGAPYWDPRARGAILGLTRDTGIAEIVTAGLQAVCYQTRDLLTAMTNDGASPTTLRVDGGMVTNNWLVQFLADILGLPVDRPAVTETTALGAAYLAGLHVGMFRDLEQIGALWNCERRFDSALPTAQREALYAGWVEAVGRVRTG